MSTPSTQILISKYHSATKKNKKEKQLELFSEMADFRGGTEKNVRWAWNTILHQKKWNTQQMMGTCQKDTEATLKLRSSEHYNNDNKITHLLK